MSKSRMPVSAPAHSPVLAAEAADKLHSVVLAAEGMPAEAAEGMAAEAAEGRDILAEDIHLAFPFPFLS